MRYMYGEEECICGFTEVSNPQITRKDRVRK